MNFEDERYVRVYSRKTVTTKLLGWEGRAVLRELLLEVDRSGVLDLEDQEAADAVSVLTDIPIEICRVGMARILERGVAVLDAGRIVMPRYIEGQEARQSDAQRQRDSRARRATVTKRDETESRSVTETPTSVTSGHQESPAVTDCHSVLSRAQPCSAQPTTDQPRAVRGSAKPADPARALSESWEPPAELVSALSVRWEQPAVRILAMVPEFRVFWRAEGKKRTLRGWNRTFQSRVEHLGAAGRIHVESAPRERPPGLVQHLGFGGRGDPARLALESEAASKQRMREAEERINAEARAKAAAQ